MTDERLQARLEAQKARGAADKPRRKPAAASKWLVAAASTAAGLGMVAGFAAASPGSSGAQSATQVSDQQPAPSQVVVVRVPSDAGPAGGQAGESVEPIVVQVPRAVPAAEAGPAASSSGGS